MRVLLFVQIRAARRPACLAHTSNRWKDATWAKARAHHMRRCPRARWWLVECENADAGRAIIDDFEIGQHALAGRPVDPYRMGGRILASGGRP